MLQCRVNTRSVLPQARFLRLQFIASLQPPRTAVPAPNGIIMDGPPDVVVPALSEAPSQRAAANVAKLQDFYAWYEAKIRELQLITPAFCSQEQWQKLLASAHEQFCPQLPQHKPLTTSQLANIVGVVSQPPAVVSHIQQERSALRGLHSNFFSPGNTRRLFGGQYCVHSVWQVQGNEQLKLLQLSCKDKKGFYVDLVPLAGLLTLSAKDIHEHAQHVKSNCLDTAFFHTYGTHGSCFGLRYSKSEEAARNGNRQDKFFEYLERDKLDGWVGCDTNGEEEIVIRLDVHHKPVKCTLVHELP